MVLALGEGQRGRIALGCHLLLLLLQLDLPNIVNEDGLFLFLVWFLVHLVEQGLAPDLSKVGGQDPFAEDLRLVLHFM